MSVPVKLSGAASVVVFTAFLGACAIWSDDPAIIACPPAQIAAPADRIGFNDDEDRLRFVASMDALASDCRQDERDVEVDIAFTMSAERGPALEDGPLQLTYFLATVVPNREIVDKQLLDVELDFAPDQPVSAVREAVTIRLPTSTDASGANYSLYLGFQLGG